MGDRLFELAVEVLCHLLGLVHSRSADDLFNLRYGAAAHAEFIEAHTQQYQGQFRLAGHFPAHTYPFTLAVPGLGNVFYLPQDRRMQWFI